MREAGVESETHAMGGTHEKGAIFPRLFYRALPRRACLALHARSCSTEGKKASVLQATLFSKSVDKILWCLHFKWSSLVEILHMTIYLCFKISEQKWIWFFCEFFLWSLLLSSDRVTRLLRFKRLGCFFAFNKYKPANYIKHKILVRVR